MSKGSLKKFRKNDFYGEDEEKYNSTNNFEKSKTRRIDRAIRTKDISALIEDQEEDLL